MLEALFLDLRDELFLLESDGDGSEDSPISYQEKVAAELSVKYVPASADNDRVRAMQPFKRNLLALMCHRFLSSHTCGVRLPNVEDILKVEPRHMRSEIPLL